MSRLIVTCHCGSKYAANPERAGQTMSCPKCGADIAIPGGQVPHAATKPAVASSDSWLARLPDGNEFGPVDFAKLKLAAELGRLPKGTKVRQSQEATWQPLEKVVNLDPFADVEEDPFAVASAAKAMTAPANAPANPAAAGADPWNQPAPAPAINNKSRNLIGGAVVFAALGIVLLVCFFVIRTALSFFGPAPVPPNQVAQANENNQPAIPQNNQPQQVQPQNNQPAPNPQPSGPGKPKGLPAIDNPPANDASPIDPAPVLSLKLTDNPILVPGTGRLKCASPGGPFIGIAGDENDYRASTALVVDLRTGQTDARGSITADESLAAISHDGQSLLVRPRRENYHSDPVTLRLLKKGLPAVNVKIPRRLKGVVDFDGASCLLIDEVTNQHTIATRIDLVTGEALYKLDQFRQILATPGANYVVLPQDGILVFHDSKTGNAVARVSVPELHSGRDMAFSLDGRRLAYHTGISGRTTQSRFRIMDLTSRQVILDISPKSSFFSTIRWLTNDYLIAGDNLIGVNERAIVARFNHPPEMVNLHVDHRLWRFFPHGNQAWLVPQSFLSARNLQALNNVASRPKRLLGPGDKVTLDFQTATQVSAEERQVRDECVQLLQRSGYTVADGQPTVLRVKTWDRPTGKPDVSYGWEKVTKDPLGREKSSAGKFALSVPDIQLNVSLQLLQNEKVLHQSSATYSTNDINQAKAGFLSTPSAQDILKLRWGGILGYMKSWQLPTELWNTDNLPQIEFDHFQPPAVAQTPIPRTPTNPLSPANSDPAPSAVNNAGPKGELFLQPKPRLWKVEPDPIPEFNDVLVPTPMVLEGEAKAVKFSSAAVGQMIVRIEDEKKKEIQRWDLRKKMKLSRTQLEDDTVLVDFRPDGAAYAVATSGGDGDLVVYACSPEGGDKEVARIFARRREWKGALCGKNLFLSLGSDKLTAFKLPGGDVAWELNDVTAFPALSWGRKYFVHSPKPKDSYNNSAPQPLWIYSTSDGQMAGTLEPPPFHFALANSRDNYSSSGDAPYAAFHPDGQQLAAMSSAGDVVLWNLADGRMKSWGNSYNRQPLRWSSPKHLLIGSELYDVERGRGVWRYNGAEFLAQTPDGKAWYTGEVSASKKDVHVLCSLFLPTDRAAEAIAARELATTLKYPPGVALQLSVSVDSSVVRAKEMEEKLQALVTKILEERGIPIADTAEKQLKLSFHANRRNEDFTISQGTQQWRIPQYEFWLSIAVEKGTEKGKQLLSHKEFRNRLADVSYRVDPSAADPATEVIAQQANALLVNLPWYFKDRLLAEVELKGSGSSHVTLRGEEISP